MLQPNLGQTGESQDRFFLEVGAPVFVNYTFGQRAPAQARLRGWAVNEYLLIDDPQCLRTSAFRPAAPWDLHFLIREHVCLARTYFLSRTPGRIGGVYVTYPQEMYAQPVLRTHVRYLVNLPVSFVVSGAGEGDMQEMGEATLFDLSLGGCGMLLPTPIENGTRLCLTLPVGPDEAPLLLPGMSRWCGPADDGPGYRAGLQFLGLKERQRTALSRLLVNGTPEPETVAPPPASPDADASPNAADVDLVLPKADAPAEPPEDSRPGPRMAIGPSTARQEHLASLGRHRE